MPSEPIEEQTSPFRKIFPLLWVALVIAVLYVAWTFYSRYSEAREARQREAAQVSQKEIADARALKDAYGGDQLTIVSFSAQDSVVKPGGKTRLCYSVSNATKVTITPDVNDVRPSYSNCVDVAVKKTTEYTLTAQDDKGNSQKGTITVRTH